MTQALQAARLSSREAEVLTHWLRYETKGEVARALFVSENTVHSHLARIRDKYRDAGRPATTKMALLVRALEDGLCSIDDIAAAINEREVAGLVS